MKTLSIKLEGEQATGKTLLLGKIEDLITGNGYAKINRLADRDVHGFDLTDVNIDKLLKTEKTDVHQSILKWAEDRNLIEGATPASQFEKLCEELGELGRALVEGDSEKSKDAIGDMIVVLTILARQLDLKVEECVEHAYDQIKDRKGRMIDGKFVKEV